MPTATLDAYDPFDAGVIPDRFPYYELLQRDAPVYEVQEHGFFAVSRFDDVENVAIVPKAIRRILLRSGRETPRRAG